MRIYPRFQNLKDFMAYCVMLETAASEKPIEVDEEFLMDLALRLMLDDRRNENKA